MRIFNLFSLIVMALVAMITWSSVAQAATSQKIHILENLNHAELQAAYALIHKKGFEVSKKPLFSESKEAMIITKTVRTESDEPSVQIEIMKKENENALPRTTYVIKIPTEHVLDAIKQFPNSRQLSDTNLMPVAFQSMQ